MAAQKKRLSLDANFVFDLAGEEDFARDLLDAFQRKGYGLALPPAVARELHLIFTRGGREEERISAPANPRCRFAKALLPTDRTRPPARPTNGR